MQAHHDRQIAESCLGVGVDGIEPGSGVDDDRNARGQRPFLPLVFDYLPTIRGHHDDRSAFSQHRVTHQLFGGHCQGFGVDIDEIWLVAGVECGSGSSDERVRRHQAIWPLRLCTSRYRDQRSSEGVRTAARGHALAVLQPEMRGQTSC